MKKLLAVLLAVLLLTGTLFGCSSDKKDEKEPVKQTEIEKESTKDTEAEDTTPEDTEPEDTTPEDTELEDTQPEDTEPEDTEAPAGDLLDAPETAFDESIEELYLDTTINDGEVVRDLQFALKQVDDITVYYLGIETDGKLVESLFEVAESGELTRYARTSDVETFVLDPEASQDVLAQDFKEQYELISYFLYCDTMFEGVQYRKVETGTSSSLGDVDVYELVSGGEAAGYARIHQETGIMVSMEDMNGLVAFQVNDLKTSGVTIPEYKTGSNSQGTSDVTGDLLDAPEKTYEDIYDELCLVCESEGEEMTIKLKQMDGFIAYYICVEAEDGTAELVYELAESGEIVSYLRDDPAGDFWVDDVSTQEELKEELQAQLDLLMVFTGYEELFEGCKYRKIEDNGQQHVYEIVEDDTVGGTITIDAETGIMTCMAEGDNVIIAVTDLSTSNVEIPAYK